MQTIIYPSPVQGTVMAPASKSSMQRACASALVRKGKSIIRNPGISNDDRAAVRMIRALGATVLESSEGFLEVTSQGVRPAEAGVNCGESGLGIRMFTPLIALCEKSMTITGEGSLLNRPMDFFDEVLPELGVTVSSRQGKLPLVLQGPLRPKNITINGSLSSQFLTGLLMAYAAAEARGIAIQVVDLKSRPYVDLTLKVMADFGLQVPVNQHYKNFYFPDTTLPGPEPLIDYTVESDWSGGAFLLVAGALSGPVRIQGLDLYSTQADKKIMEALRDCGSEIHLYPDAIDIGKGALHPFRFDAEDCPDLFPPLVALAAYCGGTSEIAGVNRLTHKESNRALTLQEEFSRMGVEILLNGNTMRVKGNSKVKGARVHSHHDHRIAMACAVAGLNAMGETVIEEADAVSKSYPNFYEHLKQLGADLRINPSLIQH